MRIFTLSRSRMLVDLFGSVNGLLTMIDFHWMNLLLKLTCDLEGMLDLVSHKVRILCINVENAVAITFSLNFQKEVILVFSYLRALQRFNTSKGNKTGCKNATQQNSEEYFQSANIIFWHYAFGKNCEQICKGMLSYFNPLLLRICIVIDWGMCVDAYIRYEW